jgi:hypothetical protein
MIGIDAFDSLSEVINNNVAIGTGFFGFMQKVGLVVKGVSEIFDSVSKNGFTLSEDLHNALQRAGILNFVVSLGTVAVRIQNFFSGFMGGFDRLSTQFSGMFSAFDRLGTSFGRIFDLLGFNLKNSTSDLSVWGTVGRVAFELLSSGITGIVFGLETFANVLNFVISVGTDFFTNWETGISNLGKRWDTLINGIVDSIKNLPLGETALNFLGIGGSDKQEVNSMNSSNVLESLNKPQSMVGKPTQMKDMLNNSAKRENAKQQQEKMLLLSMQESKGKTAAPIINVPPANYQFFMDSEVMNVKIKEKNRLDNNRD